MYGVGVKRDTSKLKKKAKLNLQISNLSTKPKCNTKLGPTLMRNKNNEGTANQGQANAAKVYYIKVNDWS